MNLVFVHHLRVPFQLTHQSRKLGPFSDPNHLVYQSQKLGPFSDPNHLVNQSFLPAFCSSQTPLFCFLTHWLLLHPYSN
ncbi:hypothetical protein HanXRQr2_Chr15g0694771 [Helianthus annuus]|uniref:Uncharacterized protein n=1 Tax=Helianthus annuus TaxID=4232 RepID=A0A9K3E0P1_HELAN|nr:hypothetical protein HanXRQr2_Chr15g0694771 [Helianthus annuus]KAJ0831407.1 hypothetical protein HanPSC8_Chr15g0666661 [Helianthus annuus]